MNKTFKVLTVLVLAIMVISFATSVLASNTTILDPKELENHVDYGNNNEDMMTVAGRVMGAIRNISIIAAVIILMVIGVKFMLGSTEEKAEYKKSLVPLIIGIILVVAATSIASFIFGFFNS